MAGTGNGNDMWKKLLIGIIIALVAGFIGHLATASGSDATAAAAVTTLEKKHDKDVRELSASIVEIQTTNKFTQEKLGEISESIKEIERSLRSSRRP